MKAGRFLIMSFLVMVSCGSQTMGVILSYDFTGTVSEVTIYSADAPQDLPIVGDPVTGSFSYDLDSIDIEPLLESASYNQSIPSGFSISLGSLYQEYDSYWVNVFDFYPSPDPTLYDALSVTSVGSSILPFTAVALMADNVNLFDSADLPLMLNLNELLPVIETTSIVIDTHYPWPGNPATYQIYFTLLTITPAPEPSTLLLLGLGAVMLRKRKRY